MAEQFDVYSDQFLLTTTPFGANLSFSVNTPHPEQSKPVPAERIGTIRMSNEHLKVMAMIIVRQIKKMESETGVKIQIDKRVINGIGMAPNEWDEFWKTTDFNLQ